MLLFGIIISFLFGYFIMNLISFRFSILEKLGLSFLIGIGSQTVLMLIMDTVGISLTSTSIIGITILSILILLSISYKGYIQHFENLRQSHWIFPDVNLVWLLFIILIVYLEYMNFAKCMFYPTFDIDSLNCFDTMGWVTAQEHTYKGMSIFDGEYVKNIHNPGSCITYMPLVQLSYAYVYLLGAETSKIIPGLVYLTFLISFYAGVLRFVGHTGAAVATFFMLITPEMIAFSSLSATNVIHAVYASLGVLYAVLWMNQHEKKFWWLSGILLALNLWARNEGVVFVGAVWLVALLTTFKNKKYKSLIGYGVLMVSLMVFAVLYMKLFGLYAKNIIIAKPFWDASKFNIIWEYFSSHWMNIQYYGWSFLLFGLAVLINIKNIIKKKDQLSLLLIIVLSMLFYMIVLYQIDYLWDSIQRVLAYSAKRFMFCFIPLLWLYIVSNYWMRLFFQKLENFLSFRPKKH